MRFKAAVISQTRWKRTPKMTNLLLTVIVPSRHRLQMLQKCLEAIRANTTVPYELIVPDDGSGADVVEWLRVQPELTCMDSCGTRLGYAKSINRGLRLARGKYVTAPGIPNDCEVQAGWAEAAVALLESSPDIGQASLQALWPDGREWHCGAMHDQGGKGGEGGINYAAVGVVRRELLLQGLQFDELLTGQQFVDVDFSWRVLAMGYRVVPCQASRYIDHGVSESVTDPATAHVMGKWEAPGVLRYGRELQE